MVKPLLEIRDVCKNFVGIQALSGINLQIYPNERVGLIGDNGAGKSTLIKVISGIHRPDAGSIYWNGKAVSIDSPSASRSLGIETVHQDLSLADNLTTVNNLFLGREVTRKYFGGLFRLLDEKEMARKTDELLQSMNASVPSRKQVAYLSGGQRQAIAIMRVLLWSAKLVIMDEPTAALGVAERRKVLALIKDLEEHGISVLLISHNLPDVFAVTDCVYVIRRGRIVGREQTVTTSEHKLIQMMIGSESAGE